MAPEQVDLDRLAADVRGGRLAAQPCVLNDGSRLHWQLDDGPLRPPFLDPELVRASRVWLSNQRSVYLLQSVVQSPQAQPAEVRFVRGAVLRAVLNGEDITHGPTVALRAGENRLFIAYGEGIGCHLRLVKPGTTERLIGIRFGPPALAAAEVEPYALPALVPANRRALAGPWRARLVHRLPPSPSIQQPHSDPGISPEARAAVAPDADDRYWEELEVPRRWKDCPGEWPDVDGEAVFRRTVAIPDAWAGKDLVLELGPTDDFDDTFVNGVLVGRTDATTPEFYAVPRRYVIPAALVKPGDNLLAVRIFDHFGDGGFTGEPLSLRLSVKE
jgi:hypothetical protein